MILSAVLALLTAGAPAASPIDAFTKACMSGRFVTPAGAAAKPIEALPDSAAALLRSLITIPRPLTGRVFVVAADTYVILPPESTEPPAQGDMCTVIWRGEDKSAAFAIMPTYEAGMSMQKAAKDGWIVLRAIASSPVAAAS